MPLNPQPFRVHGRVLFIALAAAVCLLLPRVALAQSPPVTSEACVQAYESSQELNLDGKITKAREKAAFCAREGCPAAVQSTCTKWMTDLREAQPTIAITARGTDGRDVTDVVVEIDGVKITSALTGSAIDIDPGKHTLRFTHRGVSQTQEIVVAQGIKNRPIEASFLVAEKKAPSNPEQPGGPVEVEKRGPPVGAFVLGGIGLAALAVFGGLAGVGSTELDDLRATCGQTHSCAQEDVDDVKVKLMVGDVFLASGTVALGAGVIWLIVFYATEPAPNKETAVDWSIGPTADGAFGSVSIRY